jgi:hypothetical protein
LTTISFISQEHDVQKTIKNHLANKILGASPDTEANCKLVCGSRDFAACIFVKILREIQETEVLVLEKMVYVGSISQLSEWH